MNLDEAVKHILASCMYWAPEVRARNLLPWLESHGKALYDALKALPDDDRKACGIDEIVVVGDA